MISHTAGQPYMLTGDHAPRAWFPCLLTGGVGMFSDYDRTEFLYWTILAIGVVITMLFCLIYVLVSLRRSRAQGVAHSRLARILYLVGAELALSLMLTVFLASMLRARHLFPQHLLSPASFWADVWVFGVVVLVGLAWALGLYVDWRSSRRHQRN